MSGPATAAAACLAERRRLAMLDLERNLMGRNPVSPQDELARMIAELDRFEDVIWDRYGDGGPVAELESQVAVLLGKPAAVMFPSGTMAQQSTLRVWIDRLGSRRIAVPGLSHLLHHEQDGPRLLNGFEWALMTSGGVVPTVDHLAAVPGGHGAALLELPLRDGGYLLPSWEELEAFSRARGERGVPLHLDGARILGVRTPPEAQPRADRRAGRHGPCLVLQGPARPGGRCCRRTRGGHRRGAALAQPSRRRRLTCWFGCCSVDPTGPGRGPAHP